MYNKIAGNGGGGGGAAGGGGSANNSKGGNGGPGIRSPYIPDWISSISKYMEKVNNDWNNVTENGRVIAGGGGGGGWTQYLCSPGIGGSGGGGSGGGCIGNYGQSGCPAPDSREYNAISGGQRVNVIGIPGKDGFPNTGSGGGGGASTGFVGGSGGSGIVIIRTIKQGTGSNPLNPMIYAPLEENLTYNGRFNGDAQVVGNVSFAIINNKKCVRFSNSMDNYIKIPFQNPSSFTFCYWIYVNDRNYYTAVSLCGSNLGNIENPCIQCDFGEPTIYFYAAMKPGRWIAIYNNSQSFINKWTHVTYMVNQDNYNIQLYVNGQYSGNTTGKARLANNKDFFVIGRSGDSGRAFNGYISQFYYFDRVLSAQDITDIYNTGKKDINKTQ